MVRSFSPPACGGRESRVVLVQEIEAAAQAAQHAEPEDVDLEDADGVEIVLVPFDAGALLHRRILDRDHLVEPAAG